MAFSLSMRYTGISRGTFGCKSWPTSLTQICRHLGDSCSCFSMLTMNKTPKATAEQLQAVPVAKLSLSIIKAFHDLISYIFLVKLLINNVQILPPEMVNHPYFSLNNCEHWVINAAFQAFSHAHSMKDRKSSCSLSDYIHQCDFSVARFQSTSNNQGDWSNDMLFVKESVIRQRKVCL